MATTDVWPTIHAERKALADDLLAVGDQQWSTPSLTGDWTVQQVLGHMTATAKMNLPRFLLNMLKAGFRFHSMSANAVAAETAGTPHDTLTGFKEQVDSSSHPPGPTTTWLGETIVHAEDIRRPLAIEHTYPTGALKQVADFYKGSNAIIGSKKRIAGLTLRATDTDWSTGEGPEVTGPLLTLVLAMTGRKGVLADLKGDGLATLASR